MGTYEAASPWRSVRTASEDSSRSIYGAAVETDVRSEREVMRNLKNGQYCAQ